MPSSVRITVRTPCGVVQEHHLTERDMLLVGRDRGCRIRVPSTPECARVSRYHCLIDVNPPEVRVRDMGSRNGTYVNGKMIGQRMPGETPTKGRQRVYPEHDLTDGDTVTLASEVVMEVRIEPAEQCAEGGDDAATHDAYVRALPPPEETRADLAARLLLARAAAGRSELAPIRGWQLGRQLGHGSLGWVFLIIASDTAERRALKLVLPLGKDRRRARARFVREAMNAAALRHPGIVEVHHVIEYEEYAALIMEYCAGGTVADLIRRAGGMVPLGVAVDIAIQMLDALEYAHGAQVPHRDPSMSPVCGVVHRDIKPSNILLGSSNGRLVAKIADFGLAKAMDLAGLIGLTCTGVLAGTPSFVCRRQVVDFRKAGPECDVWAAAATIYAMLTGSPPRDFPVGHEPWSVLMQTSPVPIMERGVRVPRKLATVIDTALGDDFDPAYKSAAALRDDIVSAVCT